MRSDVAKAIASIALLSALGGGYSRAGPRVRPKPRAAGPITEEEKTEREARQEFLEKEREARRVLAEERKAKWTAIYNPQYHTEPKREDFPSRQTYRKAMNRFKEQSNGPSSKT